MATGSLVNAVKQCRQYVIGPRHQTFSPCFHHDRKIRNSRLAMSKKNGNVSHGQRTVAQVVEEKAKPLTGGG